MTVRPDIRSDLRMVAYYIGTVAVGVSTILGDPEPVLAAQLGHTWTLVIFGALYAALGLSACVARLVRARRAEGILIRTLAVYAAAHGVILTIAGAHAAGLRLSIALLMMWEFARLSEGVTLTASAIRQLGGDRD